VPGGWPPKKRDRHYSRMPAFLGTLSGAADGGMAITSGSWPARSCHVYAYLHCMESFHGHETHGDAWRRMETHGDSAAQHTARTAGTMCALHRCHAW
jgi:hypothetical protein